MVSDTVSKFVQVRAEKILQNQMQIKSAGRWKFRVKND